MWIEFGSYQGLGGHQLGTATLLVGLSDLKSSSPNMFGSFASHPYVFIGISYFQNSHLKSVKTLCLDSKKPIRDARGRKIPDHTRATFGVWGSLARKDNRNPRVK